MSLFPLLGAITKAASGVRDDRRKRNAEDLESRLAGEDRVRKQRLEDQLLARSGEEYEYKKSLRPLEKQALEARIAATQSQSAAQQAKATRGRPLPASAVEKSISVDNLESGARNVQDSLEGAIRNKVDATGRVGGVLPTPTWWKNTRFGGRKGGDEGLRVRNVIGSLKATIAKERAGTNMTPSELNLLESYIPNDNDDEPQALEKAKAFIRSLQQVKENRKKAYAAHGFGDEIQDDEAPPMDRLPFPDYD